jgi:hypothetical protein
MGHWRFLFSRPALAGRGIDSHSSSLRGAIATKQSRTAPQTGLLRGACHRAGHFGPDPLARNDKPYSRRVLFPLPLVGRGRGGGREVNASATKITLATPTPPRVARRPSPQGEGKCNRSRGAPLHPSYESGRIVSGEWKSIRYSHFTKRAAKGKEQGWCLPLGLRQAKNERKRIGSRTPTDAMLILPGRRTRPRPHREAHIYSTAVLVPRSLSSQGTQPQAMFPGTRRTGLAHSVGRALPAPICPSPAIAPRAPVIVPRD